MEREVLFSFVGNHDPLQIPQTDLGPVLSLLAVRHFDHVVLLITGGEYTERAHVVQTVARERGWARTFSFVDLPLHSVVDYEELYEQMSAAVLRADESLEGTRSRFVLLDPGTPQMQTIWVMLVQSGILPAQLLQGTPAHLAGGSYRYRTVRLDATRVPIEIRRAGAGTEAGAVVTGGARLGVAATAGAPASGSQWIGHPPVLVGESPAMRTALATLDRYAPFDGVVLITGETGTGKELFARRLHAHSPRCNHPFIAVNAASFDAGMVESKLFGHRKGAFTGAVADRPGAFRAAEEGTIFLDEIGELNLELQARLLRVIDRREVTPVGADHPEQVNARVVAATNRDLGAMVLAGTFRADLFERLRQFPVRLPPLRERDEDIRRLAPAFIEVWSTRYARPTQITPAALNRLAQYDWPGNVRQLENLILRVCVNDDTGTIDAPAIEAALAAEHEARGTAAAERRVVRSEAVAEGGDGLPEGATPAPGVSPGGAGAGGSRGTSVGTDSAATTPQNWNGTPVDLPALLAAQEREWFSAALRHADGNRAHAARLLGLNAPAFRKALRERVGME